MVSIFGVTLPRDDPRTYIVALVILTAVLVVLSKWSGSLAVGLALTVVIAVAMFHPNSPIKDASFKPFASRFPKGNY